MAMEAAVDIDTAGDFSVHSSHSGLGSRSRSSAYSSAGITGVDVESGEAALLAGAKGHRSTYAKLAEEALLGAAGPPSDPEGAFERVFEVNQPVDLVVSEYQDANGGTWRMGSAGAFWRLDAGNNNGNNSNNQSNAGVLTLGAPVARCCVTNTEEVPRRTTRTTCKAIWWIPITAGILTVAALACCWDLHVAATGTAPGGVDTQSTSDAVVKAAPEDAERAAECCTAATATCFACKAGESLQTFCHKSGLQRGIIGCGEAGDTTDPEDADEDAQTEDEGVDPAADKEGNDKSGCCSDATARCLSCNAGQSPKEYCAVPAHQNVSGCGGGRCSLLDEDTVYPGGDLYSVGGVPSATACCNICREESKCTSWSWGGKRPGSVFRNRCFLKRQAQLQMGHAMGYVSGLPGRDLGEYQLKSRHGLCLELGDGRAAMQACSAAKTHGQKLGFERGIGRLSIPHVLSHTCLKASAKAGSNVTTRPCGDEDKGQQWSYNSTTGLLRSGDGLCLTSPERNAKNSRVEVAKCDAGDEAQQWSMWSVELLSLRSTIEAMRQEALEPTTTTITTTVSTTTTVTTTHRGPTLYCFSVMVSWAYEPTLISMQANHKRSIFLCDGYDVYSDKVMHVGDKDHRLKTRRVHGTDLKCHKGGVFNTLLNTPVFIKVWEQVLNDGRFKKWDWTIKVDCDAVFLPERLVKMVEGPALEGAQDGRGIFLNNCGFGLHGPIEVVSMQALLTYEDGYKDCPNPPQEDVYLQACMNHLGVKQVNQFTLLSEDHCRTPNWEKCQSEHVSFHPFKSVKAYLACQERAEERSSLQVKK